MFENVSFSYSDDQGTKILEDVSLATAVTWIHVNLPLAADLNGDGVPDFLDINQGVETSTTGSYADIWDLGAENAVTAIWSRTAGVRVGKTPSETAELMREIMKNLG